MVGVKRALPLGIIVVSLFLFFSCAQEPTASGGSGTETGNAFSGRISFQDGSPAAGVTVMIFPVDFMPSTLPSARSEEKTRTTDKDGYYYYGDLGVGRYNVDALKESLGVFIDSIVVDRDSTRCSVPGGVLDRLGAIKGVTYVVGFNNVNNLRLMLYIPGTGRLIKPAIGSAFVMDSVAPGFYKLVFDPTLLHYRAREFDLQVKAGETVDLDTVYLTQ